MSREPTTKLAYGKQHCSLIPQLWLIQTLGGDQTMIVKFFSQCHFPLTPWLLPREYWICCVAAVNLQQMYVPPAGVCVAKMTLHAVPFASAISTPVSTVPILSTKLYRMPKTNQATPMTKWIAKMMTFSLKVILWLYWQCDCTIICSIHLDNKITWSVMYRAVVFWIYFLYRMMIRYFLSSITVSASENMHISQSCGNIVLLMLQLNSVTSKTLDLMYYIMKLAKKLRNESHEKI